MYLNVIPKFFTIYICLFVLENCFVNRLENPLFIYQSVLLNDLKYHTHLCYFIYLDFLLQDLHEWGITQILLQLYVQFYGLIIIFSLKWVTLSFLFRITKPWWVSPVSCFNFYSHFGNFPNYPCSSSRLRLDFLGHHLMLLRVQQVKTLNLMRIYANLAIQI